QANGQSDGEHPRFAVLAVDADKGGDIPGGCVKLPGLYFAILHLGVCHGGHYFKGCLNRTITELNLHVCPVINLFCHRLSFTCRGSFISNSISFLFVYSPLTPIHSIMLLMRSSWEKGLVT